MAIAIITLIILILLNAFFAASEIALIGLNDNKIERQAKTGNKKAEMLRNLITEPSRFLSTIQIGITLAGFLASAFAADFFAGPLASALSDMGVPLSEQVLQTVSLVAITLILSYFTLVFGELVPKQLALQKAEAISFMIVRPLTLLFKITLPVVKLLQLSTNGVVRLFGVDPNASDEEATEEEIRMMVDIGGERGTIQALEKTMINRIFEFNDKDAGDIATHRTSMTVLPADASLEETLELIDVEGYTRFPVYERDIDNIVGILVVKDLFRLKRDIQDAFDLKDVVRQPLFVAESYPIDRLLARMQKEHTHIAIVLDEFGGTEGMVTIEDILEELVGEISSESQDTAEAEEYLNEIETGVYEASGTYRLWELEEYFHKSFPVDDFETLNGFLVNEVGHIPSQDERPTVDFKDLRFEVKAMGDNRIEEVVIRRRNQDATQENEE